MHKGGTASLTDELSHFRPEHQGQAPPPPPTPTVLTGLVASSVSDYITNGARTHPYS